MILNHQRIYQTAQDCGIDAQRFQWRAARVASNRPIGRLQCIHALELAQVVGHQRQPLTARVGSDVQIIDADGSALFFY